MRLIDADKLTEQILQLGAIPAYIKLIDNAPTVEERPQGEWLHEYILDYRCSICNSYPLERGDYPELSKYCPACGARMNIEVNNNG